MHRCVPVMRWCIGQGRRGPQGQGGLKFGGKRATAPRRSAACWCCCCRPPQARGPPRHRQTPSPLRPTDECQPGPCALAGVGEWPGIGWVCGGETGESRGRRARACVRRARCAAARRACRPSCPLAKAGMPAIPAGLDQATSRLSRAAGMGGTCPFGARVLFCRLLRVPQTEPLTWTGGNQFDLSIKL